ncbi:universal stress protein [Cupriavidus sp. 2TAF22]|uniref:universal stress protein n=1 Tax=unclassified Cupriavidus TaxID=2640874 RepID=UPI003F8E92DF
MYRKILLGVDGSRSSDLAVSQAIILAKATGSEVRALFVVDDSDVFYLAENSYPSWLMESILAMGHKCLETVANRLTEAGVPHSTKILEKPVAQGRISESIVREADYWGADLIVLGTHGRRGIKRLVMGSVSQGVVCESNKPVLLIRSELEE